MFNWIAVPIGFVLFSLTTTVSGQTDTSIVLSKIVLQAEPLKSKTVGAIKIEFSDNDRSNASSIAQLLETSSGIYVKNYGPGSISSLALRGSAGGHTSVIWNGLSISNPMLGILDFALLPTAAAGDINLQLGSGSSTWGSGAIGGVLSLNNVLEFDTGWGLELNSRAGSFSRFQNVLKTQWGSEKWSTTTTLLHLDSKNDFPLQMSSLSGSEKLEHGGVEQSALVHSTGYKIDEGHIVRFHTWLQASKRDIPPTSRQLESVSKQNDKALRLMADYQLPTQSGIFQFKMGHFRESLDYRDELAGINSESSFDISQGDASYSFKQLGLNWVASISGMFTSADIDSYNEAATEWRSSIFLSSDREFGSTLWQLSMRQPWIDGQSGPLIPQLGWAWNIDSHWEVQGRVSRNFRHPTLNDKYWSPGGNIELKQEMGWAQEITLGHSWNTELYKVISHLTGYNRTIEDWILWAPLEGNVFWSATNLGEVNSHGAEFRNQQSIEIKPITLKSSLGYNWTRSVNENEISRPKIKRGQTLFYVPEHSMHLGLSIDWQTWRMKYTHRYVSQVQGVNKSIDAFDLGNALVTYGFAADALKARVFLSIKNIWDRRYEIVEFRPMPGRNYEVGVSIKINQ